METYRVEYTQDLEHYYTEGIYETYTDAKAAFDKAVADWTDTRTIELVRESDEETLDNYCWGEDN